jgi:hypothetical protein
MVAKHEQILVLHLLTLAEPLSPVFHFGSRRGRRRVTVDNNSPYRQSSMPYEDLHETRNLASQSVDDRREK